MFLGVEVVLGGLVCELEIGVDVELLCVMDGGIG